MSDALTVWVDGIGCWSPGLTDWPAWRALLRGEGDIDPQAPAKPRAARLAASERRRVSTHVLAAVEAADQAVAMRGGDGAAMACVFASAWGDSGIMDYMCAVLAATPRAISPTRFHNSVHNAAAGYWTIASHCQAASQAVAAGRASFAAGLLEAAVQANVEGRPVLLVAHDEPGSGPLADVFAAPQAFACALVLAPHAREGSIAQLELSLAGNPTREELPHHRHAATLARGNPAARSLALLEALATQAPQRVTLAAAHDLGLAITMQLRTANALK